MSMGMRRRPESSRSREAGGLLGELLVGHGAATEEQVRTALKRQRRDRRPVGQLLQELGVAEAEVMEAVAAQNGATAVDLTAVGLDEHALLCVPGDVARRLRVFPFGIDPAGHVQVAVAQPADAELRRQVEDVAMRAASFFLASEVAIRRAQDRHYTVLSQVGDAVDRAVEEAVDVRPVAELVGVNPDAPVVQIVNLILTQGLRDRASDIHIEPQADRLRIRYRVDGALRDVQSLPPQLGGAIASRLKIIADMDIVDRHRAQDGQFAMRLDGRDIDIRVATVETVWGEKVVLRLLDRSRSLKPMSELGLRDEEHERMARFVSAPYGMMIVSGPTGAGKTTTLYAALNELDRDTRNITTIEDPVEYQFPDINQIQINRLAGTTFANGLRAILRQDPDAVLIGEVRDVETAQIAVQSALTGHLVLCSLHAADAVGAMYRFLDMGIESFLIASAVIGVAGQRLVRTSCTTCLEPYTPRPEEVEFYRRVRGRLPAGDLVGGKGCRRCAGTGFFDRTGVFEAMTVNEAVRKLIVVGAPQDELRAQVRRDGMRSLQEAACDLVDSGRTTIAEAMRTVHLI